MEGVRISIVTVVHNAVDTIEDTILSVGTQSHPYSEHIVIDGGSADGTMEIVDRYRHRLSRVVSEPDRGIYDAMNKGLALATGDVVGFLNADDIYADNTVLEQIANVFKRPETGVCYADLVYVKKEHKDKIVRCWKSAPFIGGAFARGWCPAHPTFYARRSLYSDLGYFDQKYRLAADADMMIRFLEKGRASAVYVPRVWVKMRMGGQTNISISNIIEQNREILNSLNSHGIPVSPVKFVVSKIMNRIVQRWSRSCAW